MSDHYILNGKIAVPEPSLMKWAVWMEKADRIVKKETVGDSRVSTAFLGLDHSFRGGPPICPPILFETLVFDGPLADEMERYPTWEKAEAGHDKMVERVRIAEAQAEALPAAKAAQPSKEKA